MPKRSRPVSLSRHLSERAREAGREPAGLEITDLGAAAAEIVGRLKQAFDTVVQATETMQNGQGYPGGSAQDGSQEGGADGVTGGRTGGIPFSIGGKQGRLVFGYNMRVGLDGLKAEPFGDLPPSPPSGAAQKPGRMKPAARAPIVDIFEETDSIRVVAELPGAAAQDVSCTMDGETLLIETRAPPRYSKSLRLPGAVRAESLTQSCSNGILEIRLEKVVS